jgi:hypothetical protein
MMPRVVRPAQDSRPASLFGFAYASAFAWRFRPALGS